MVKLTSTHKRPRKSKQITKELSQRLQLKKDLALTAKIFRTQFTPIFANPAPLMVSETSVKESAVLLITNVQVVAADEWQKQATMFVKIWSMEISAPELSLPKLTTLRTRLTDIWSCQLEPNDCTIFRTISSNRPRDPSLNTFLQRAITPRPKIRSITTWNTQMNSPITRAKKVVRCLEAQINAMASLVMKTPIALAVAVVISFRSRWDVACPSPKIQCAPASLNLPGLLLFLQICRLSRKLSQICTKFRTELSKLTRFCRTKTP